MKSKPVAKGSAQAASESAKQAFATPSDLNLDSSRTVPPEQEGRKRLADSFSIQRSRIIPDPEQPRKKFDEQELVELTASIKERGIKQPLTVRWNASAEKYMVIDGGRRYEAATRLKLEELPCWVQTGDRREILIDQIVHNWQRSNLKPMETADVLARLRDEFNLNQVDLARVTGKPKGEISKFLAMHDRVVDDVQDMARNDPESNLTRRHLYGISKLSSDKQKPLAQRVKHESLTVAETERLIEADSPMKPAAIKTSNHQSGIAARQRRFKTEKADVVVTFRRKTVTDGDIRDVIAELARITA